MSRNASASFARANRVQDAFARNADFGRGRGHVWMADVDGFDPSTLPARTTAVHRTTPAKPAEARKVLPMGGQRPANTVRKPAAAPVVREVEVIVPEVVAAAPVVNEVAVPPQPEPVTEPEPTLDPSLVPARDELVDFLRDCDVEVIERMSARDISRSRQSWIALARDVLHRHELSGLIDLSLDAFNFVEGKKKEAAAERKRQAEEEELRTERGELIEHLRSADMEVFAALWVGQNFLRETIIVWTEGLDIATVRDVRWRLDKEVKAHATAKARAKPADRAAVVIPAKASAPKQERIEAVKPGKKKPAFNILDHMRANAGKPVVPVAPPPSAAELAEIERRVNGQAPVTTSDSSSVSTPAAKAYQGPRVAAPLTLRERIQNLDPKVVARIHRDGHQYGAYRWPTIERMLGAMSKHMDTKTEEGLGRFVARCEQG